MVIVCDGIAPNSTPSLARFDAKKCRTDSRVAFLELRQQRLCQFRGKRVQLRQPRSRDLEALFFPREEFAAVASQPHAEVSANQISRRTKNVEAPRCRRSKQRRAIPFPRPHIVRI